jgi:hypothetical protein
MFAKQELVAASNPNKKSRVAFFGPQPLLKGEDETAYNELLAEVSGAVNHLTP